MKWDQWDFTPHDLFGAQILDAEREEMTVERVRQYVEQVRAFSA